MRAQIIQPVTTASNQSLSCTTLYSATRRIHASAEEEPLHDVTHSLPGINCSRARIPCRLNQKRTWGAWQDYSPAILEGPELHRPWSSLRGWALPFNFRAWLNGIMTSQTYQYTITIVSENFWNCANFLWNWYICHHTRAPSSSGTRHPPRLYNRGEGLSWHMSEIRKLQRDEAERRMGLGEKLTIQPRDFSLIVPTRGIEISCDPSSELQLSDRLSDELNAGRALPPSTVPANLTLIWRSRPAVSTLRYVCCNRSRCSSLASDHLRKGMMGFSILSSKTVTCFTHETCSTTQGVIRLVDEKQQNVREVIDQVDFGWNMVKDKEEDTAVNVQSWFTNKSCWRARCASF